MKDLEYGRIVRRIGWLCLILAAAGAAAWRLLADTASMLSFLGGASIAGLSFFLLHRLVDDLQAAAEGRPVKKVRVLVHAFRMLILGGAAYVILEFCGAGRVALASGLTVAVTAATVEVLIELFYARA
ncbi:MAG: ATP synthase subunit I [Bryobacteraceae bacterium]